MSCTKVVIQVKTEVAEVGSKKRMSGTFVISAVPTIVPRMKIRQRHSRLLPSSPLWRL